MDSKLVEIKKFIDEMIELYNEIQKEQEKINVFTNLLNSCQGNPFKIFQLKAKLFKVKLAEKLQWLRIKKLAKLNNEFITRTKTEDWFSVPGYKEYIDSVKDRLAKI